MVSLFVCGGEVDGGGGVAGAGDLQGSAGAWRLSGTGWRWKCGGRVGSRGRDVAARPMTRFCQLKNGETGTQNIFRASLPTWTAEHACVDSHLTIKW